MSNKPKYYYDKKSFFLVLIFICSVFVLNFVNKNNEDNKDYSTKDYSISDIDKFVQNVILVKYKNYDNLKAYYHDFKKYYTKEFYKHITNRLNNKYYDGSGLFIDASEVKQYRISKNKNHWNIFIIYKICFINYKQNIKNKYCQRFKSNILVKPSSQNKYGFVIDNNIIMKASKE